VSRINRPSSWPDRVALGLVALAFIVLILPFRVKGPVLAPLGTVLLAPLRGAALVSRTLGNLTSENRRLTELATQLAVENARLASLAAADTSRPAFSLPMVRAQVIARDLATFERYLVVSRGSASTVRPGCPVITANGVAGKVIACGPHQSLVQTLYATDCRISVANARSRVPALTRSDPLGRLLLDYVPRESDFKVNDTVVTAGLGGIFPKGLRVGTVISVPRRVGEMFQPVEIRPFVNIATLQEVMVIVLPDSVVSYSPDGWLENLGPKEVSIPDQPTGQ